MFTVKYSKPECQEELFRENYPGAPERPCARIVEAERASLMILGAHVIVYSKDAEADRDFLRDVLGFPSVDAGHGWLIFALPPSEVAVHPAAQNDRHELYFMCSDLKAEMGRLQEKGVHCSEPHQERWGSITKIRLPGGGEVGLYQPKHPTALALASK